MLKKPHHYKMSPTFINILIASLLIILSIFVILVKRRYKFWINKGIPQLEPKFLIGDSNPKVALSTQFLNIYRRFKATGARHGGLYSFLRPVYMPIDLDIVKHIMVKDFDHFMNHATGAANMNDPLSAHLFNLEGERWKVLRSKLSPTFTSNKMKMMFETFLTCTKHLEDAMSNCEKLGEAVDVKEVMSRFTTDVIGSCAFGIECNSLKNPDSEFRQYGKKIFQVTPSKRFRFICMRILPKALARMLSFPFTEKEVENFFINVVKETVDYREKNNVYRKDFMHLLLQLKNRDQVIDDGKIMDKNVTNFHLNIKEITAQCFVFFVAGFETSSTTMTFALYELATNPECQSKLRNEINNVLKRHNDELSYEAVADMTYLEHVIKETLRKYPPLAGVPRECNKPYRIPGTDIELDEGTRVHIPILGIHMDADYHPDPEKFDPDRFNNENERKRPAFSWIPFGEGPRICIGLRFGEIQTKIGLASMIRNFEVTLNAKTKTPIEMDPRSFVTAAKGGIWVDLKKIRQC